MRCAEPLPLLTLRVACQPVKNAAKGRDGRHAVNVNTDKPTRGGRIMSRRVTRTDVPGCNSQDAAGDTGGAGSAGGGAGARFAAVGLRPGQRHQDVGVPGAVQAQRFVEHLVAVAHVQPRRVHAQQQPRQRRVARRRRPVAHHHRRAARAAVHARVGQEVALALEADAERRRDDRLAHHGQVMQAVVEAEREARYQQRRADADPVVGPGDLRRRERAQHDVGRQLAAVERQHRDVHLAAAVAPLSPHALAVGVERDREAGRARQVDAVEVQLDLDAVGQVLVRRSR